MPSSQPLKAVLLESGMLVLCSDPNGILTACSEGARKFFQGIRINHPLSALLQLQSHEAAQWNEILSGKNTEPRLSFITAPRLPDGTPIVLSWSVVRDTHPVEGSFILVAAPPLLASETSAAVANWAQSVLDIVPVGIFVINREGKPIYANTKSLDIMGKGIAPDATPEELSEIYQIYKAGTDTPYPTGELPVIRALHGESNFTDDIEVRKPEGNLILEVFSRPVYGDSGEVEVAIAVFNDVTLRKRTEEKLRESSSFLESILENIPHMIFVKKVPDLHYVKFNKAGEDLVGIPRSELIGKNDYDFFPKEMADFFTGKDKEVLASGELKDIPEEPIDTRTLGKRILHTKKVPLLDETGTPLYLMGISEDITEMREVERRMRKYLEDLEHANQSLDQFAYVVSHDLKAPIRGIASLADWIAEDLGDDLPPNVAQMVMLLKKRVARMESMINGVLEYSRIGRKKDEPALVEIKPLLEEVIDLISPPPGFRVVLRGEFPAIHTDRVKIIQVFSNLIVNAIKHHNKPNGIVEISCRREDEFYEFSVLDDGPGILPEYHEKIFLLFQRLNHNEEIEGVGIGLSIVKKIINDAGGSIRVISEPGKGADFRFTWPVQPAYKIA